MKQEALKFFTDLHLTSIAFFLFFITFILIGFQVFSSYNKKKYERLSLLPINEESQDG